jgi:hypothetical protein
MKKIVTVACGFVSIVLLAAAASAQSRGSVEAQRVVASLAQYDWKGATTISESPVSWDFAVTPPMNQLLAAGADARPALLAELSNEKVLDQVLFLLGGVGDESSIDPILTAMGLAREKLSGERRERVLAAGSVALSNITGEPVVWWYCGGVVTRRCSLDPLDCWSTWWLANKARFRASDPTHRKSRCRPGYGLYREMPVSPKALSN